MSGQLTGLERAAFQLVIVDDEDIAHATTFELLVEAGWPALSVGSGLEALRLLADMDRSNVIVILDMMLPDLSGEKTLGRLRAELSSAPGLLVSGEVAPEGRGSIGQ